MAGTEKPDPRHATRVVELLGNLRPLPRPPARTKGLAGATTRPGLFRLVPAERGCEAIADTNPLAAGAVLMDPYFFSFGTACTQRGLTEQVFLASTWPHAQQRLARQCDLTVVPVGEKAGLGFAETNVLGELVPDGDAGAGFARRPGSPALSRWPREKCRGSWLKPVPKLSWEALLGFLRRGRSRRSCSGSGTYWNSTKPKLPGSIFQNSNVLPANKVLLGARQKWGTSWPAGQPVECPGQRTQRSW